MGEGGVLRRIVLTTLVLLAVGGTLMGMFYGPLADTSDQLWPASWLAWPIVGWVILMRRPGNRIGMACLAIGLVWGLSFGLQAIVLDVPPAAAAWIELVYTVLGVVPWLINVWLLTTFPTGEYSGSLEKFVGRALIAVGSLAVIGFVLSPVPLTDTGLENPLGLELSSALDFITGDAGFFFVVGLGAAAILSLVLRRRRSTGIERQQYRWLLLGASLFLLISAAGQVLPEDSAFELLWLVGGSAIPICIGVAVVRYRLFEIDRVISRTVGYALVVGVLGLVFLGAVTLLTWVSPAESQLAVAGSTLVVAALFNPLRKRLQGWVDRRFNRSKYDAERVMEQFAGSLQDRVDEGDLVHGWVGVVSETMEPALAGVWVRDRS
jgi:hypothetical protein